MIIIGALLAGVLAGCSSSPAAPKGPRSLSPAPTTGTAVTTGTLPTTGPSSSTSPPSAPSSSASLSPFEADPAVQAMRTWADLAARTVNSGRYTDAKLRAVMTPFFARWMKHVLGEDVGLHYPGPIPLQPVGVTVPDSTHRIVKICDVYDGYARDPASNRPKAARKVASAAAYLVEQNGTWRMNALARAEGFSCSHVKVRYPSW